MTAPQPTRIRGRLARALAGTALVASVLYGAVLYVSYRTGMSERLDERLAEDWAAAEHSFEVAVDGSLHWIVDHHEHDRPAEAPFEEIVGPDGRRLRRGGPASEDDTEPHDVSAGPGGAPLLTPPGYRTYEAPYELGGENYLVRVGRSEDVVDKAAADMLWLLLFALVPVVVLAYFTGRWLAARTLEPVRRMTEQARTITADRLSARLPVADPSDELGALATVFNQAIARLEDAFERMRRFTADASHELRTPLASLQGVGEVALQEDLDKDALREVVGSMLEECERLSRLAEDLLVLARADAGQSVVEIAPLDLSVLAREAAEKLRVVAEEQGRRIIVEADGAVMAQGDRDHLASALLNLIHNALTHAGDDGDVQVRVDGAHTWIEVVDHGPGIAPEDRERVFERFVRLDSSRTGRGSGLGLAIARWAAESSGGRLDLDETPGGGCTFRVRVPGPDDA